MIISLPSLIVNRTDLIHKKLQSIVLRWLRRTVPCCLWKMLFLAEPGCFAGFVFLVVPLQKIVGHDVVAWFLSDCWLFGYLLSLYTTLMRTGSCRFMLPPTSRTLVMRSSLFIVATVDVPVDAAVV